MSHDQKV